VPRWLLLLAALLVHGALASAQSPAPAATTRLTVFLDCLASCDFDLVRQEITYVDWVRDRTVADVHLLVTSQGAGGGGSEYTLAFLGQRSAAGRGDTIRFTTNPTTTSDEQRRMLAHHVAAGLVPFLVRGGNARLLRIAAAGANDDADDERPSGGAVRDPWRAWVFELGVDGGLEGEALYESTQVDGRVEANRVTEIWKFNFEFEYEYQDDRVTDQELDDAGNVTSSETFRNLQRNWDGDALLVRSVGSHLAAGFNASLSSNTFRNIRRALQLGPAIEYNLFPYREATRRELTFQYGVGVEINRYVDTTIFDRVRETLPVHYLQANYESRQTWGSAELRAEHRNYLSDGSKRNTEVGGFLTMRVFKGFSVNTHAEYSWIRDQITLRKGEGDQVDVLLRRRELLTGYQYSVGLGLSYTFGSIFNNVVNPRF
jgi:hypothetical protein